MLSAELILRATKKDSRAEKEIFKICYPFVRTCCVRYLASDDAADDASINTFLNFYKSLNRFTYENERATFGFLKKIAVNECLMILRKTSSLAIVSLTEQKEAVLDNEALNQMATAEIYKLVKELPVGYRTVFNLYEVEGYTHVEIAAMLKISPGTSKSQLNKARQALQKKITIKENYYAKQG